MVHGVRDGEDAAREGMPSEPTGPSTDRGSFVASLAARLPRTVQQHLGTQIAQFYGAVVQSPPPATLHDLVLRLTDALATSDEDAVADFRAGLLAAIPHLRAFAISLSGSHHRADDLVQETMLKALRYHHRFERGTNLHGWLFTILRHQFHDEFRRRRREVEDVDGVFAGKIAVPAAQEARVEHHDLLAALAKLPPEQREALVLIGAEGVSYEEAAAICRVPIGTIKSRLNRARARLAALLGLDEAGEARATGAGLLAAGAGGA